MWALVHVWSHLECMVQGAECRISSKDSMEVVGLASLFVGTAMVKYAKCVKVG